jgi:hypothetical protein
LRLGMGPILGAGALRRAMIGITISGNAYAAIVSTLPASSADEAEIAPDREYQVWLPRDVVNRLRAMRGPGETFTDVILRLASSGELTLTGAPAQTPQLQLQLRPHAGPNA